jgi:hypothetical protein
MKRLARRALVDLVAAAGVAGNDERPAADSSPSMRKDCQHIDNEHESQISGPAARFFGVCGQVRQSGA